MEASTPEVQSEPPRELPDVERLVFFTDAVVAIAITLLILPLLDGVAAAAGQGLTTAQFVHARGGQLFALVLSFVIIASFWDGHRQLFLHVTKVTRWMVWLDVLWLFAIVWLPVATAMVGLMPTDRLQAVLYVGAMELASLANVGLNVVIARHPQTWAGGSTPWVGHRAEAIVLAMLFGLALTVILIDPALGYRPMFLLLLAPLVDRLVIPRMRLPRPKARPTTPA